jgi:hypothetical protein
MTMDSSSLQSMADEAAAALGVPTTTPTLETTTSSSSPSSSSSSSSTTTGRDPTNLFPVLPSPLSHFPTTEATTTNGTPAAPVNDSGYGRLRVPHQYFYHF